MSCPYHKKTNDDSKTESPKEIEKPVAVETKPTEAKKCPYSSSSSKDNSSNKVEEKKVESTEKKCPYSSKNKELAESEAKAVAAAESGDVEATNKAMKEHFVKAYNQVIYIVCFCCFFLKKCLKILKFPRLLIPLEIKS